MKLDRAGIARLVPHQGAMCLLEEVLDCSDERITCRAVSHRDANNPLRANGSLAAIVGAEYAAQAVAVHGGLLGNISSKGFLASLRDVVCSVERLDDQGDLTIHANRVAAESGRLLYDFRIEAGGRELVKGRLSVVLRSQ